MVAEMARVQSAYDAAIVSADLYFNNKDFSKAIADYQKAQTLKPDETYPKEKISESGRIMGEMAAARKAYDAAILAVRQTETLKRIEDGFVIATLDRDKIWVAQTPQVFRRKLLLDAYAQRGGFQPTDEARTIS